MGSPTRLVLASLLACVSAASAQTRGPLDLANAPVPSGARRIAYGTDPLQFGELRLPSATAAAIKAGDAIHTTLLASAGHFVFIDPQSEVWPQVLDAVKRLVSTRGRK